MASFTVNQHVVTLTGGNDTYNDTGAKLDDGSTVDAFVIYGLGGDDTIVGGYYTGAIYGGDGNDALTGYTYHTLLYGGAGANSYRTGQVELSGRPGDYLFTSTGTDSGILTPLDGSGDQTILGGVDQVQFGNGQFISFALLSNYLSAGATPRVAVPADPVQPDGAIHAIASGGYGASVMTTDSKSVLLELGGTITRVDLATGATTGSWQLGDRLGGIDVTPDGRYLLATELTAGPKSSTNNDYHEAIYVHRLDLATGEMKTFEADVPVSTSTFFEIAATSDGKALVSQTGGSTPLFTMDVASGTFTASTQTYASNVVLASSGDHSHVLIAPASNTDAPLYLATAGAGITAAHTGTADGVGGTASGLIAVSNAGKYSLELAGTHLYLFDSQLKLAIDITALHPEFAGSQTDGIIGAAFSPDANSLYLLDASADRVFQLSTSSGALQASIPIGFDARHFGSDLTTASNALQISNDGHYLGVLAEGAYPYTPQYEVIDLTKVVAQTGLDQPSIINASSNSQTYYGFGGDDTFVAVNGATLVGGTGNDTYIFPANAGSPVIENANGGFDTIYAQLFTLPANVERLIGLPGVANDLSGNADANVIVGNTGNDGISPGLGADLLTGGAGNDIFIGSMADFSGDTITDLAPGDEIHLSDAYIDTFSYSLVGDTLTYGPAGYVLTLPGGLSGPLAVTDFTQVGRGYTYHYLRLAVANQPANLADFNGDGHGDILWRNASGAVSEWQLTGSPSATQARVDTFDGFADTSWKIVDTFDFNGDGRSDILWRNANGAFSVWNATSGGFAGNSYTDGSVGNDWRIAAVGDVNGDGKDDLLWQRSDGAISTWRSTGSGFAANTYYHASPGGTWKVVGMADFNGDGKTDILWRDASGAFTIWSGTASGFTENSYFDASVNTSWHIQGLGDFTGDGRADILWRNDNGAISLWRSNGAAFDRDIYDNNSVGNSWHIAAVADFNDDGRADILWHNDNGAVSTWEATASGFTQGVYNNSAPTSWSIAAHSYDFG